MSKATSKSTQLETSKDAAKVKSAAKLEASSSNEDRPVNSPSNSKQMGEILGAFAHALRRPDTYIGSIRTSKTTMPVFDDETKTAMMKTFKFNPGLFHIIREIGSNAIDNKWRSEMQIPKIPFKTIEISIDLSSGMIEIFNDGYCIPCSRKEYSFEMQGGGTNVVNIFPVEAFFGYINSGTNYDDTTIRKTSGKNGMGATLTNIYSVKFTVDAANPSDKRRVIASFGNNGNTRNITDEPFTLKKGYTRVSFTPDYKYFSYPSAKVHHLDNNMVSAIKLYAHEISMITNIPVKFTLRDSSILPLEDGEDASIVKTEVIRVPSLEKYVRLFYPDPNVNKSVHFRAPNGDECVIVEVFTGGHVHDETDSLPHISFVNGSRTKKGGVHVTEWQTKIIGRIVKTFNARKPKNKKSPHVTTTARGVYPYLMMFLRCEVDRPTFDDQTKEILNGLTDESGKKAKYHIVDPKNKKLNEQWKADVDIALAKIMKWQFVKHLDEKLSIKAEVVTKKEGAVKSKVHCGTKYLGANFAGMPGESHKTTLWIAEGDSAKTTVEIGISNIEDGSDYNGVFALKGKMINVVKHTDKRVSENSEIKMLIEILGLRKIDYSIPENLMTLRYGRIVMATDQDDDGHHIKGLVMNFFASYYPTLIPTGFLHSLSTAVVVLPVKKSKTEQKMFFSNPDFAKWQSTASVEEKKRYGTPIYYKGLGSIPPRSTPVFFQTPRLVEYLPHPSSEEDMVHQNFVGEKEGVEWRKEQILKGLKSALDPDAEFERIEPDFVYEGRMTTNDFIRDQIMIYNRMSLHRAIPCLWDGFKDSQRKALFGIIQENLTTPENIESLTCSVKKVSAYHHGANSLSDTIIKMTQGFVGSNNIPYCTLDGQTGSRKQGGADASAPRYPSTKLEDIMKCLFVSDDYPLLPKNYEGSKEIEPVYYAPVVCMLLVNGANGVGVGWSSTIPAFNPEDIFDRTEEFIALGLSNDGSIRDYKSGFGRMVPWYRGFTGTIENIVDKTGKVTGWHSRGILRQCTDPEYKGWWEITEMPIGLWTDSLLLWMQHLETGCVPEGKNWKKREVKAIHEHRTYVKMNSVHILFRPTKDFSPDIDTPGNFNILKTKGSYSNMWAIDENNYPHKFSTPEDILLAFCKKRYHIYQRRYESMLNVFEDEKIKTYNQYRFVKAIVEEELDIRNKSDEELDDLMCSEEWNFDRIFQKGESEDSGVLAGYAYLFNIKIRSMTKAKFEGLFRDYEKIVGMIEDLGRKTPKDLWLEDLAKVRNGYKKFLLSRDDNIEYGAGKKKAVKKPRVPRASSSRK